MGEQLQAQAKGGTVSEPPDKVLAFLIADVRGYTSFTRERGDAAAAMLAKKFADLAREAVAARSGAVLELRGDEALAVFASTAQAVRAAVEFQATCAEESRLEPAFQLPVGIGIDAGVAIPVEDGYRGVALNMAARMCSGAAAGQVLVTRTVVDRSGSMEDVVFADRGMATFKGFDAPTEVIEALSVTRPADDGAAHDGPARAAMVVPTLVLPPELDSLTPLIDRDTEMQWLARLVAPSASRAWPGALRVGPAADREDSLGRCVGRRRPRQRRRRSLCRPRRSWDRDGARRHPRCTPSEGPHPRCPGRHRHRWSLRG